jgi:hypothetical protein
MILFALIANGLFAAAEPEIAASSPQNPPTENRISQCVLGKIAEFEQTSPDKLGTFKVRSANKAMAACRNIKAAWTSELDDALRTDPKFTDPILRKAHISTIVSSDELAVMLLISMKAK